MVVRPTVPWYNDNINAAKRLSRKAERKWRRTKSDIDYIDFKKKKNYVTYIMNQARQEFYRNFIEENSIDQGRLFKAAKKLLSKRNDVSFPQYSDKVALVNDIGGYFVNKIEAICSDIEASDAHLNRGVRDAVPKDLELDDTQIFSDFQHLTEDDVNSLVQKSAKRSCSLDPIPTSV